MRERERKREREERERKKDRKRGCELTVADAWFMENNSTFLLFKNNFPKKLFDFSTNFPNKTELLSAEFGKTIFSIQCKSAYLVYHTELNNIKCVGLQTFGILFLMLRYTKLCAWLRLLAQYVSLKLFTFIRTDHFIRPYKLWRR